MSNTEENVPHQSPSQHHYSHPKLELRDIIMIATLTISIVMGYFGVIKDHDTRIVRLETKVEEITKNLDEIKQDLKEIKHGISQLKTK